jgi:hypothetical protein
MDKDGNKVATLLCSPRSPKIPAVSCVIEIANRELYFDSFHDVRERVMSVLTMAPVGMNRVDLCCDFEMSNDMYEVYLKMSRGEARVKALRQGSVWWKDIPVGMKGDGQGLERVPHCMTWGGKESTLKWKIYYKWLELQEAEPEAKKPYITDLWKREGFNEKAVWRIEVSVHDSNALCRLDGRKVKVDEWFDERIDLFKSLYSDKFVIRAVEGHKDRRNDTVLPFLGIHEGKLLRGSLPKLERADSDPEKRVVCKLWSELMQVDTQCNGSLSGMLKANLCELLQRPNNVWVLQRMYGVTMEEIVKAVTAE